MGEPTDTYKIIILMVLGIVFFLLYSINYILYIILAFFSLFGLLILIHLKPTILSNRQKRIFIFFLLAGLVLSVSNYYINKATQTEKQSITDYKTYRFNINSNPSWPRVNLTINDLRIYLDYSNNSGNISFNFWQEYLKNLDVLRIDIPDELNITNVNLSSDNFIFEKGKHFNLGSYLQEEYKNYVNIVDFNITDTSDKIKFVISFEGDMKPNGNFIIDVDATHVYSFDEKSIILDLGPYLCRYPCFGYTKNSIIVPEGYKKLAVFYPRDYYEDVPEGSYRLFIQEFGIITINEKIQKEAELLNSIGSGLIVSAFILFVESIGESFFSLFLIKKEVFYKTYRCKKCNYNHRINSEKGKEHIIYK